VAVFSDGTVVTSVTGALVAIVIGIRTVAFVVGGSVVDMIVYREVTCTSELEVAVLSEGTVTTSVTGSLVAIVIGIRTVAFVVGGSVVEVIVYNEVTCTLKLEVAVLSEGTVTTSVTGSLVARVIGIRTVAFVVGGSEVDVIVYRDVT